MESLSKRERNKISRSITPAELDAIIARVRRGKPVEHIAMQMGMCWNLLQQMIDLRDPSHRDEYGDRAAQNVLRFRPEDDTRIPRWLRETVPALRRKFKRAKEPRKTPGKVHDLRIPKAEVPEYVTTRGAAELLGLKSSTVTSVWLEAHGLRSVGYGPRNSMVWRGADVVAVSKGKKPSTVKKWSRFRWAS